MSGFREVEEVRKELSIALAQLSAAEQAAQTRESAASERLANAQEAISRLEVSVLVHNFSHCSSGPHF